MIHTFTHKESIYEVDDEIFFDKQSKEFQQLWQQLDKVRFEGCTSFEDEGVVIMVYDRGGVIIHKKESEVSND